MRMDLKAGFRHALTHFISVKGVAGFMKGAEATVWRHAVWNGGYFGVIK